MAKMYKRKPGTISERIIPRNGFRPLYFIVGGLFSRPHCTTTVLVKLKSLLNVHMHIHILFLQLSGFVVGNEHNDGYT